MVAGLQRLLADIYDLPTAVEVGEFLFTDRALLPAEVRATGTDEQLLVEVHEGTAAVGLFLDAGLVRRLEASNPLERLHGGNIADFWTALEGVSHFVYLTWRAGHDRPVSLLELELQAEIDKYVGSAWLLRAQHPRHHALELRHWLFDRTRVDPGLAGERVGLYQRASRYAERFCRRLERRLDPRRAPRAAELNADLRRFYRWGGLQKCRHIEQLA